MLASQFLIATVKETPADAQLISHQLMLRAGLIRKLASGLYSWLPFGFRVLHKVEEIVRQEMNDSGALQMLMPAVQPAELWQESKRWEKYGAELLRLKDRHGREFCFGPTHEEVITDIVRRELKSYKQLPLNLYQIQTKFRDEIRPRFGVMRAREFLMKDAYSFDIDKQSMQTSYDKMYAAYTRIFQRLGLKFRAVLADTGSIGGSFSHEFQVLANSGEDQVVYSDSSDYAANIEKAEAALPVDQRSETINALQKVPTPGLKTIAALSEGLSLKPEQCVKTLIVKGEVAPFIALVLRGDHELNDVKAGHLPEVLEPVEFATDEDISSVFGCGPGSLGPVKSPIPVIVDRDAAVLADFACGANEEAWHFLNVNWDHDASYQSVADLRCVVEGDLSPDGKGRLKIARGIEVGHIFQLGEKYSESLGAMVLNQGGKAVPLMMGCYGLGISRVVAAAVEQNFDERGILWPSAMAPFTLAIVPVQMHKSEKVREVAETLYQDLQAQGIDVLFDNRKERPGVMFADMDLMGIPHRVVIGGRGLDEGYVEYKARKGGDVEHLQLDNLVQQVLEKL